MTMRKAILSAAMVVALAGAVGCAPRTFVKTMEPSWASVEVRSEVPYEKSWPAVVDMLVRRFDIETMSKEDGYLRTTWLYTWTGKVKENYRVRVTVKFNQDRTKCDIKSEAEYDSPGRGWVMGYDTRLLETLKTDLMGTIGRTTR